jgi:hypothetical protein
MRLTLLLIATTILALTLFFYFSGMAIDWLGVDEAAEAEQKVVAAERPSPEATTTVRDMTATRIKLQAGSSTYTIPNFLRDREVSVIGPRIYLLAGQSQTPPVAYDLTFDANSSSFTLTILDADKPSVRQIVSEDFLTLVELPAVQVCKLEVKLQKVSEATAAETQDIGLTYCQ